MEHIWQALGLTALFTLGSVTIVGGIMWLLYIYFNRYLPGGKKTQQEGDAKNLND